MDKEDVLHICNIILCYYSAIKRANNASCSSMDGPRDYHIKVSQKKTGASLVIQQPRLHSPNADRLGLTPD